MQLHVIIFNKKHDYTACGKSFNRYIYLPRWCLYAISIMSIVMSIAGKSSGLKLRITDMVSI